MKIVFRIEHPQADLRGPFSKANPNRDALSAHTKATGLDEAYGDIIGFDCGRHICAVESLQHILDWFGPFLPELHAQGFALSAYEVAADKLLSSRSQHQVAFDRADAAFFTGLYLDAFPGPDECQLFDRELFESYRPAVPA